ncbi:hypothetical protein CO180_00105 [candidate division WWE3 bacterium CG_4_9_14_3_um_filter_41_6]|uniref:Type II secretion system protein GspG C-terminal domain-containing protein n=1 Tax=candidate division WWE3 bacterium CG_4_10_14_0_2_um_filter_41_14 TaxID=1975072 RepID=A0A2M7TM39_UNCKA|nr:MAG: hypothetical protein COY32_00195 [candidate division WWE3 bacterium CG_4_10_14_0_2_um_filter_41_14]PJA39715.1 MAG: hypothetical protein CO180_00105 [candidate division WWE3 bacterium CG_4_9_14_3_um_filter_41_6]
MMVRNNSFSKQLIALIFLIVLLIPTQIFAAVAPDLTTFDESTQREIREEAARLGMSVDDFIGAYVVSEIPTDNTNGIIISSIIGSTLLIAGASFLLPYLVKRRPKISKNKIVTFDITRKDALAKLVQILEAFYTRYHRFPTEDEFATILSKAQSIPADPHKGEPVPNSQGTFYGYYYDQRNPITLRVEQTSYRLWTFLENGERYLLSENKKTTDSTLT